MDSIYSLTKEQRKNALINMSDHDLESYDFEIKYYNDNGDKLESYEDHENVCVESHELVIEEIPVNTE